ncbi:hypothetical protein Y032_0378g285 [Ancylostoma ceylanicum]|uniref:C-type lectin domain-containing protein n=1 Tax=Ancylostoma ceylanicum TaxID=53326 RepID=A0A016RT98_9BILA|nr:hypothetical protein Y032_0378g285 [Ancylostoma ceylanicum]
MLLLLQQQLLLFAVLLPTVVAHCPIGTISRPEFGRCYKLSSYRKPFYMAEEACQAIGGHLVSVGNGFENAMLADIARSQNLKGPFFIGYNRIVSSDWSWIDGYNVSNFTKWGPGIFISTNRFHSLQVFANESKAVSAMQNMDAQHSAFLANHSLTAGKRLVVM